MARNTQSTALNTNIPMVNLRYSGYLGTMIVDDSVSKTERGPSASALAAIKGEVGDTWKQGYGETSRTSLEKAIKLGLDSMNSFEGRLKGVYLNENTHNGKTLQSITVMVSDSEGDQPETYCLRLNANDSFAPQLLTKLKGIARDELISVGLYAIKQDKKEDAKDNEVYYNHQSSVQRIVTKDDGSVERIKVSVKDDQPLRDVYAQANERYQTAKQQFGQESAGPARNKVLGAYTWDLAGRIGDALKQQRESTRPSAPAARPVASASTGVAYAPPLGSVSRPEGVSAPVGDDGFDYNGSFDPSSHFDDDEFYPNGAKSMQG